MKREGIVNARADDCFREAVEATGRKQLAMAGVTTDVCLVYPAIRAVAAGYDVQAILDASGSPFELSEDTSRRRMENAGVTLTATNTLLAELAQDWSRPEGTELLGILDITDHQCSQQLGGQNIQRHHFLIGADRHDGPWAAVGVGVECEAFAPHELGKIDTHCGEAIGPGG